jgi:hypothetical protein
VSAPDGDSAALLGPTKAYPVLVIDSNAVLSPAVAVKRFQAIGGRGRRVREADSLVDSVELPPRYFPDRLRARPPRRISVLAIEDVFRTPETITQAWDNG